MSTMPIYALVDTWNASGTTFTGIGLNVTDTASAAGSLLLDLQVGGTSQFKVSKGGAVTALGRATIDTLTIGLGGQTAVASNTALGFEALNSASLTGIRNTSVGYQALRAVTTGTPNTAVGAYALTVATTAQNCTAVGSEALYNCTTANGNTAVGKDALQGTTTGALNTAIGFQAARENTGGEHNVAIGFDALRRFNASYNTAVGYRALRGGDATTANNTGTNNIGIGYQAGDAITTGSTNIVIGYDIDVDSATSSNQINIGDRFFHDRIRLLERTSDPAKPAEGNMIVWLSDGTGLGDDGDVIISSTAGGVTNYAVLFDHSAGTLWP
jgi:hypothetical protein